MENAIFMLNREVKPAYLIVCLHYQKLSEGCSLDTNTVKRYMEMVARALQKFCFGEKVFLPRE